MKESTSASMFSISCSSPDSSLPKSRAIFSRKASHNELFAGDVVETNFLHHVLLLLVETTTSEGFIIQGKDVRGVKLCAKEESFEASRHAVLEISNGPVESCHISREPYCHT